MAIRAIDGHRRVVGPAERLREHPVERRDGLVRAHMVDYDLDARRVSRVRRAGRYLGKRLYTQFATQRVQTFSFVFK